VIAVPADPAATSAWATSSGRITALLLVLAGVESEGAVLPEPLAHGRALRAFAAAVRGADPATAGDAPAAVPAADAAVLGDAARVLGLHLCRYRAFGAADPVVTVLLGEAAVHDVEPEDLVAHVAAVHGMLDPRGTDAPDRWRAAS
jgi:hypothetical protein